MVKAKWKDLNQPKPPPPPVSWAEANTTMNKQPGWVRKSNEQYTEELKAKTKRVNGKLVPKNRGQRCDHCITDDHERCWRVVCYCPCYRERKLDGWPFTSTTV